MAKGFAWKDSRDAAMWENGAVVSESDKFGEDVTNPLSIYGLTAPTFEFVNAEGETVEDEYLEVDNTGKLKFTDKGKTSISLSHIQLALRSLLILNGVILWVIRIITLLL